MFEKYQNMRPASVPSGASFAAQAAVYARRAQVAEFTPARGGQRNPATIDLVTIAEAIHRGNAPRRAQAAIALQEFMRAPMALRRQFRSQVRELVTVGDHPTGAAMQAYIDRFLLTVGETDTGFEQIFATHDVGQAESQLLKGSFKVFNVTSGITFAKRVPGEPVKMAAISGAEVSVNYDMLGGGLGIERVWWDDQDYLLIADMLMLFREAAYYQRAKDAYSLITSLGAGINYSTGADLIAKLNGACSDIIRSCQGKGMMINANTQFVILVAPEHLGLIESALRTQSDVAFQTATGKQKVVYRMKPIASVHIPASGTGSGHYVIAPKGQLKWGDRMDLTLFGRFDPTQYADDLAGFIRYGGIVGESNQVRRVS